MVGTRSSSGGLYVLLLAVAAPVAYAPAPSNPDFSCSHTAPPAAPSGLSSSLKDKDCAAWQAFYDDAQLAAAGISHDCRRDPCEGCVSASGRNLVTCTLNMAASYDRCNGKDSDIGACNHISSINLSNLKLAGSIGTTFAQLSFVNDLRLSNNALAGSLPDLSTMGQLAFVDLSGNKFTGVIGQDNTGVAYLSNNKNLQHLDFSSNQLHGQLPNFQMGSAGNDATSSQLAFFDVSGNHLVGTPPLVIGQVPVPGCNPRTDQACDGYYLLKGTGASGASSSLTGNMWFCPPAGGGGKSSALYAWANAIDAGVLAEADYDKCIDLPDLPWTMGTAAGNTSITVSFAGVRRTGDARCGTNYTLSYWFEDNCDAVAPWMPCPPCDQSVALESANFVPGPDRPVHPVECTGSPTRCTAVLSGLRNGCRVLAYARAYNCRGYSNTSALSDVPAAVAQGYRVLIPTAGANTPGTGLGFIAGSAIAVSVLAAGALAVSWKHGKLCRTKGSRTRITHTGRGRGRGGDARLLPPADQESTGTWTRATATRY
jgi:hypothetical protein